MTPALQTDGLGKRYRKRWALHDCTLELAAGRVTALVGPNGAGKSTLLNLMVGLLRPTTGRLFVLGESPENHLRQLLPRVGFVAQDLPLYGDFTVAEMLRMGRALNVRWEGARVEARLRGVGIPLDRRVGTLSGGEHAQVALALALGKDPELLLLDEPLARLDPLARRELLASLMDAVSETGITVLFSSHDLGGLERVCDHLVLLGTGSVQLVDDIADIRRTHRRLVGPRKDVHGIANVDRIVECHETERQTSLLARVRGPIVDPAWDVQGVSLEDVVLAYLGGTRRGVADPDHELALMP